MRDFPGFGAWWFKARKSGTVSKTAFMCSTMRTSIGGHRMKPTNFYFFSYPVEGKKRPAVTTYRMTVEEAAKRLPPGHEPVPWSLEVRNMPETDKELMGMSAGCLYVGFGEKRSSR